MLDSILNSVKKASERVQRRGEEVAQVTRLRVEVFQLNRELDSAYARLGRSYHASAALDVLQGVREEIGRIEEEIKSRERLITELGEKTGAAASGDIEVIAPTPKSGAATAQPNASTTLNRPPFQNEPVQEQRAGDGSSAARTESDAEGR